MLATVTWAATTPAIASINNAGLATGLSPGSTPISATSGTVTGSTSLTVAPPTLSSIAVTPASITVGVGATQQYTAVGTYSDSTTQNLTTQAAWASDSPSVVSITTGGFASVQGTSTVAAQISASFSGVT